MRTHKKLLFYYALIILLIGGILVFPSFIRRSLLRSLSLCYDILIPALFPFLAISGIWLDLTAALSSEVSASALWISWLCGYPIGTKTVCELYETGEIQKKNALCLLACTANASPPFLLFAVSAKLFGSLSVGFCLILAQVLLSLAIYFCFYTKETPVLRQSKVFSLFPSMCQSVQNAAITMLQICAFTVIFGIIADAASQLSLPFPWNALLGGSIEIMHGISLVGTNAETLCNIWIISTMVGFSGLCIWMQTFSFAVRTALPVFPIVIGKLIYTLLLPPLTVFLRFFVFHHVASVLQSGAGFLFLPIILIPLTSFAKRGIMKKNNQQRNCR